MSNVKAVTAAGGVVFKNSKDSIPFVLLIFRYGVWDLPKGKLEEGESIEECAVREVTEEVGLSDEPEIVFKLPHTYHEYKQRGTHYGKTTYWFGMKLPSADNYQFDPQTEEDIEKVSWFPLTKAREIVGYDNLANVLNAFEQKVQNK